MFVNPFSFGAVGDGVSDDTAAIQSAVNQAVLDDTGVFFPAGKYKTTSTITVSKPIALVGEGSKSAFLIDSSVGPGFLFQQENPMPSIPRRHIVKDLSFTYAGAGSVLRWDYTGIASVYPDAEITGNRFDLTGCSGYGIYQYNTRAHIIAHNQFNGVAPGQWTGIYLGLCFNHNIHDNIIWSSKAAISVNEGEGVRIHDNDFVEGATGIKVQYHPFASIQGNMVDWFGHAVWLIDCWNSTVTDNYLATGGSSSPVYINAISRSCGGNSITNNKILNYMVHPPTSSIDEHICGIYMTAENPHYNKGSTISGNNIEGFRVVGIKVNRGSSCVLGGNIGETSSGTVSHFIDTVNIGSPGIITNNVSDYPISPSVNDLLSENIGFPTEDEGTFIIPAGASSKTVSLPFAAGLKITLSCEPSGNLGNHWISTWSPSSFTFNCSPPTPIDLIVFYRAKARP